MLVLSALSLLLGAMLIASPAQAHTDLVSSSPADGATLDAAPRELTFTFSEDLLPDFVTFVASAEGVDGGELRVTGVDGPTATLAWPADAPGGEWRVDFRVVSQDGHPIEGGITFSYADASPSPTSASPAATSSAAATASPTAESPTPSPTTSPASSETTAPNTWLIALGAAALIAVVVGIIVVVRRRS